MQFFLTDLQSCLDQTVDHELIVCNHGSSDGTDEMIKQFEAKITILALMHKLDIVHNKIALEINKEIIPRSQFEFRLLENGDQIEIVTAVGGG